MSYYEGISRRYELDQARYHIQRVLDFSGVGPNPPLTDLQYERLTDAYKEIGKVLQTIREK